MINHSRLFRKNIVLLVLLLVLYSLVAIAEEKMNNQSNYVVVSNWPLLPDGFELGSVSAVAVDSHGDVFVFHRANRKWPPDGNLSLQPIDKPTVAVIDGKTGALIREWGSNTFAMPHGMTIDKADNIWLTDVAFNQVYKYSHDGKRLMTLGIKAEAGDDKTHFDRPTAVAVNKDFSFYIADGYNNSRIIKFSPTGKFLFQWGVKGEGPGQFNIPHGIGVDKLGHVYVADRGNARVQIFSDHGRYISEWKSDTLGHPYALAFGENDLIFVVDGGDQTGENPATSSISILKNDGATLNKFGSYGNKNGQFMMAHAIAIDHDGAVYVGDITGARIQKFIFTNYQF